MNKQIFTIILPEGEDACRKAGDTLRNGGIVAFPTDTVYGLGAVFTDEAAVKKIFAAKGRDEGKPLSILVSGPEQVEPFVEEIPRAAYRMMEAFWPGALTLIFRKKPGLIPDVVTAGGDTVGFRMPNCHTTLEIIRAAGSALAAPSANISGKRSSVTSADVKEDLNGRIDMIVDGGSCPIALASTVVDMTGEHFKILREGIVTAEMLEQCIKE